MTKVKVIYLASPYTFNPPKKVITSGGKVDASPLFTATIKEMIQEERYKAITRIAGKLQDKWPHAFILPITMSHHTVRYMQERGTGFSTWRDRDLAYISRCDEVWVAKIPGWEISQGVTEEIEFARKIPIPVRYINPDTCDLDI